MHTTLAKIRSYSPCKEGWEKLLRHLKKTSADDEPLPLLTVLDSNGVEDAIWCLRAVEGYEAQIRLFAVFVAKQVSHLMQDPRSLKALDVAEAFAKGEASAEDLQKARVAADAAAADAAYTAYAAYADYDTAAAATAAAYAATAAAYVAAYVAAYAAYVAYAAVDAAAYSAHAAAYAPYAAAAADAAQSAAKQAARKTQETYLRTLLCT